MIALHPRRVALLLLLALGGGLWLSLAPATAQTPPSIIGLFPASGPTGGGTNVIIAGSDFTGVTGVTFGGVAAAFNFISDSTISAT